MGTVNLLLFQSKDQLVWETFVSMKIEESYRVKKDNVLGFPCCMKNEKYVIRDAEHGSKTRNVEELFDEVDKVISVSSTSTDCSSMYIKHRVRPSVRNPSINAKIYLKDV